MNDPYNQDHLKVENSKKGGKFLTTPINPVEFFSEIDDDVLPVLTNDMIIPGLYNSEDQIEIITNGTQVEWVDEM